MRLGFPPGRPVPAADTREIGRVAPPAVGDPLVIIAGEGNGGPHGGRRSGGASSSSTQKARQEDGQVFQGLAISLMAGEVASTLLSRMTVPLLYYMSEKE